MLRVPTKDVEPAEEQAGAGTAHRIPSATEHLPTSSTCSVTDCHDFPTRAGSRAQKHQLMYILFLLYITATCSCRPIVSFSRLPDFLQVNEAALQQAAIKRSSITEANLRFLLTLSLCRPFLYGCLHIMPCSAGFDRPEALQLSAMRAFLKWHRFEVRHWWRSG